MAVSKGKKPKKSEYVEIPAMGDAPINPVKLAVDLGVDEATAKGLWQPNIVVEPDSWHVQALYPAGDGKIGVKLGVPYEHTITVGALVRVNKQTFRVTQITTDGLLLAPFNPHAHGVAEHNPLEHPGIKKEWAHDIGAAQQKQGTQKSDIEFMQDMFEDTPIDKDMVKFLNLKEEYGENIKIKSVNPAPTAEELDAFIEKHGTIVKQKPHSMDPPMWVPVKSLADEIADKTIKVVADQVDKTLLEIADAAGAFEKTTHLYLKVKQAPQPAKVALVKFLVTLTGSSITMASSAIISKAWFKVDPGLMESYAIRFSEMEDAGVVFEVKEE